MRHFFLLIFFISNSILSKSQTPAITDKGEQVILYDDGTWKPLNKTSNSSEIQMNDKEFVKSPDATFQVKSAKINAGVFINPKKWDFKKAEQNKDAEYQFQLKNKDAYGMLIVERIGVPLETLKNVAIENGRKAAPDVEVIKQEYRNVNGMKMLYMQMNGTMKGIKFTYVGYYYSSDDMSIQFVAYTSQNLLKEYRADIEQLLNGLVIMK
jgi:hypothetical protein